MGCIWDEEEIARKHLNNLTRGTKLSQVNSAHHRKKITSKEKSEMGDTVARTEASFTSDCPSLMRSFHAEHLTNQARIGTQMLTYLPNFVTLFTVPLIMGIFIPGASSFD